MNKKTVSPIIAVVLLITITLTAAMLLRTWYFGEQQESQERTSGLIDKKIRETEEKINVESYDTNGTLYIRNTGLTTIDMNATKIYEEGSMLNITVPQLLSGEVESVNLTLDMNKTYKITTATGYTAMFEYAVGNVFLYSEYDTIFNGGSPNATTVTSLVTDNFGNRAGNNIDVTFHTDKGTFSESGNSDYTASTNATGEATATLEAGTGAGNAKISAVSGNYTSMISVMMNWWNTDWTKKREITITENSGNNLTDYPVRLHDISYDSDMQSEFGDIRFTDSSYNELDYWMENYTASISATVWVNTPSVPANSNATIYMYYGNPLASTESSYENTMNAVGEAGTANVGGTGITVNLTDAYTTPHVFAVPRLPAGTYRSGGVSTQHHLITTVLGNSFNIVQVESPSSGDGSITSTDISYIVLEEGTHYIGTDLLTEVGTTTSTGSYVIVNFSAPFALPPVVLADTETNLNTTDQIYARGGSISSTQYTVQVEEDDDSTPSLGSSETIAYAAIKEGNEENEKIEAINTGDGYDDTFTTWNFSFSYSSTPAVVAQLNKEDGFNSFYAVTRNITLTNFELAGEEPASWDGSHTTEEFSWVSVPSGTIYGRRYISSEPSYTLGSEESI